MATQSDAKNDSKTGSNENEKETYHYQASSFVMKTDEEELFELVQLSGVPMDKELLKVILELLKLNVAPVAILHVLKSLKSQSTSSDSSLAPTAHPSKDHTTSQKQAVASQSSSKSNIRNPTAISKSKLSKGATTPKEHSSEAVQKSDSKRKTAFRHAGSHSIRPSTGSGSSSNSVGSRKETGKST